MKKKEMVDESRVEINMIWCSWLNRYLIFIRKIGDFSLFHDLHGKRFLLTQEEVDQLGDRLM